MLKINYGDDYVKVNNGDVFAGSWDMLEDCFGITVDSIIQWCRDNDYTFAVTKYTESDAIVNALWRLRSDFLKGNDWVDGSYEEYSSGVDDGLTRAAVKIETLIKGFEKGNPQ